MLSGTMFYLHLVSDFILIRFMKYYPSQSNHSENFLTSKFPPKAFFILFSLLLTSQFADGQIRTRANGNWENPAIWPTGNNPTHNLPGSPDVIVDHDVRVHTEELRLGRDNHGILIVNNRLSIETLLGVNRNHWEIRVSPNAQLLVSGGVFFEAGGGEKPSPDLVISGTARIAGGIHGRGDIRGTGTLVADFIGSGVNTAPFTQSGGTVVITQTPLPIELLSFTANVVHESVRLNWATATETNNDFFTIERSTNLNDWEVLGFVDGAGTSSRPLHYSFTDYNPMAGVSYYRLKQTDYDGKFEYFGPLAIQQGLHIDDMSFKVLKQFDHWVIALPDGGPYKVEVFNLLGQRLVSLEAENDLTIQAPQGPVIIRIFDGTSRHYSRVVQ